MGRELRLGLVKKLVHQRFNERDARAADNRIALLAIGRLGVRAYLKPVTSHGSDKPQSFNAGCRLSLSSLFWKHIEAGGIELHEFVWKRGNPFPSMVHNRGLAVTFDAPCGKCSHKIGVGKASTTGYSESLLHSIQVQSLHSIQVQSTSMDMHIQCILCLTGPKASQLGPFRILRSFPFVMCPYPLSARSTASFSQRVTPLDFVVKPQ